MSGEIALLGVGGQEQTHQRKHHIRRESGTVILEPVLYRKGKLVATCQTIEDAVQQREPSDFIWVHITQPTPADLDTVTAEFPMHPLVVEDILSTGQRTKIERYSDSLFAVLKLADYKESLETIRFEEIEAVVNQHFIVTVQHGNTSPVEEVRQRLKVRTNPANSGPFTVLYELMAWVVSGYFPIVEAIQEDIYDVESEVMGGNELASRRVYSLSREVIAFQKATQPLATALDLHQMRDDHKGDVEVWRQLRDVHDNLLRVTGQLDGFRELLSNILSVNLTLVSINQTNQTKKISAWAAILVIPTIITGIYGMNFKYMPELDLPWGYPAALLLMLGLMVALYIAFRRADWL